MTRDEITLILNGDVPLDLFASAIHSFSTLVGALSKDIAGNVNVDWDIVELQGGSAVIVAQGTSEDIEAVEKIVSAFGIIGSRLQQRLPIPYSKPVSDAAASLTKILNGKVTSIEFQTEEASSHIVESVSVEDKPKKAYSFGTLFGRVETLSKRKGHKFNLYDSVFDKSVTCHVPPDRRDMMPDIWDKYVGVTGAILRDIATGRPLEIHDIEDIEIINDRGHGKFLAAKGVLSWREGDEPSDKTIRRLRDNE